MQLDQRLQNDCIVLAESDNSYLLLLNNALIPWFIIVPKTDKTEFIELSIERQHHYLEQINALGRILKTEFSADKLNIATIGNIVEQLHLHIVGRKTDDFCWPNVVWGQMRKESYSEQAVYRIGGKLSSFYQQFNYRIGGA